MNKTMFFYTRKEQISGPEGETTIKEYRDAINISKIIRAVLMSDNDLVVLLDDIHERMTQKPDIDIKTNRVKGVIKTREVFQTEVHLSDEDITRFYKLTNIDV